MKTIHMAAILIILVATIYVSYEKGAEDTEKTLQPIVDEYKSYIAKGHVGWEPPTDEFTIIGNVSGDFVTSYHEWSWSPITFSAGNESKKSHLNITIVSVKEDNLDTLYAYVKKEE